MWAVARSETDTQGAGPGPTRRGVWKVVAPVAKEMVGPRHMASVSGGWHTGLCSRAGARWPAGKAVATSGRKGRRPSGQPAAAHPLSTGRSCMKQIWSCSGSGSTLRSWNRPLTVAVSGMQRLGGAGGPRAWQGAEGSPCSPSSSAYRGAAAQPAEEGCGPAGHGGALPSLRGQGAHGEDTGGCTGLLPRLLPPTDSCLPPARTSLPPLPHLPYPIISQTSAPHFMRPNTSDGLQGQGHPAWVFPKP